jgi:hypothetical protein
MMWQCPLCNGTDFLLPACPHCADSMEDMGKVSDYYADYSPYREIDDLKWTDGYADLSAHLCMHYFCCPSCGYEQVQAVRERHE